MSYNQYSFYSKLTYSFKKDANNNRIIWTRVLDNFNDNSELIWNTTSNLLDYYWAVFFEKYGTNLQDLVSLKDEFEMPYQDYLTKAVESIVTNTFAGMVNVDNYDENETSWNVYTSVPPSTLLNCLRYTPWRIGCEDIISSFITYQVVCAVEELHLRNIPHMGLTLDNIYIDEHFMVKISLPRFDALTDKAKQLPANDQKIIEVHVVDSKYFNDVLWKWMCGEMSNLDYLLYLNQLAGRSKSDPNNHPMIPWVTDFSEKYGGFRDLKISKFRINKGDEHLDKIYQDQEVEVQQYNSQCPLGYSIHPDNQKIFSGANKTRSSKQLLSLSGNIGQMMEHHPSSPHHVSDILSELSYYAYMARVTPIDVLKKYYRSFYNPQEFRWDMAKMYAWSPDECIPQFFTDPSLFRSTHSDMPDIGLPLWCKDAEEFVNYHREMLESEQVSKELNHWIDLVFGYKLLGDDAIDAKNVHRQFTEKSSRLTNNGLSVLFRKPHPKRLCCIRTLQSYFGPQRPREKRAKIQIPQSNESIICLPEDYDPCELIEYYKSYSMFIQDSCSTSAIELKPAKNQFKSLLGTVLEEDIFQICCLIVELFNADKLRSDYLLSQTDFPLRLYSCTLLFSEEPTRIPLAFRDTVEKVLLKSTDKRAYVPNIFELKRSRKWLVFDKCVVKVFELTKSIQSPHMDIVIAVKHFFISQSEVSKFSNEMLAIITPHLISLLNMDLVLYGDQALDILVCILHRFGMIAGPKVLIRDILPSIIKLYPMSQNLVISKHSLLYQRNFLNLLLIRIGMGAFLNHMIGLLVRMLVIGQKTFGSSKESNSPDMDLRHCENDSESLNDEDKYSFLNLGDEETAVPDAKRFTIDAIDGDSQSVDITIGPMESDSISQCGMDFEEVKTQTTYRNGCIPNSLPNLLDLLPFSDNESPETPPAPSSGKNGTLSQLLTSPFKKRHKPKDKTNKKSTTKVDKRKHLSQDCSKMSLAQLSYSSLIWLADLIGPIEASSIILKELLAQFSSCYQGCNFEDVQWAPADESNCSLVTGTYDSFVQADRDVVTVLDCLREFIGLYGLAVVWHQIHHFIDTLLDKSVFINEEMLPDTQASLVCSLSLMRFLSMLIPNEHLDSFLSNKVLDEYLPLIIRTIGNMSQPFPNGKRPRQVLLHKVIEIIYLLSSRLKLDQIKDNMNNVYKLLFGLFSKTFDCNEQGVVSYRDVPIEIIELNIKDIGTPAFFVNFLPENNDFTVLPLKLSVLDSRPKSTNLNSIPYRTVSISNREMAFEEMKSVITTKLASVLYISFAKLIGDHKLDSLICNQPLIHALVAQHVDDKQDSSYSTPNKVKQHKLEESLNFLTNSVMIYKRRHITDVWKEYWKHELGFGDTEPFDIKQMCLGKFEGHNGAMKGFDVLNCENGFLSYSKDKVVKLYSIADIEYSNPATEVPSRFSYIHQKPVYEAIFIEQMRMAVSLDGIVHLWDPFVGKKILNSSLSVSNPNWNSVCSISPSQSLIAVTNSEGRIHIVDLRSGSSSYSYHINTSTTATPTSNDFPANTGGLIRKVAASPDGNCLLVGNSDGFMSMLDLRMSKLVSTWRPHQQEISQVAFMKNWCVTSSVEPTGRLSLVNLSNLAQSQLLHGPDLGSIHSLMILRDQIVVGASQNRFGLFTSASQYKSLHRLSSSLYKGSVSAASLLLHNRLLLLGNETGSISLWY